MKTIEVSIVELYVNGVLHSLDLAGYHLEKNNQRSAQIEIENAKVELRALSQDLKSPRESQMQEDDMPKWEYLLIEVWMGKVDQVNYEPVYKTPPKGLSGGEMYTLAEYLSIIGQEGWEIVGTGTRGLLINPEHNDSEVLIAKRLKP